MAHMTQAQLDLALFGLVMARTQLNALGFIARSMNQREAACAAMAQEAEMADLCQLILDNKITGRDRN
jgi:hypothetical protein